MNTASYAAHVSSLLTELATRIDDEKPQFSPAVGIVNDISRFLASASLDDAARIQTRLAEVRDKLRVGEDAVLRPAALLDGQNNELFLAGVLWTLDVVIDARMSVLENAGRSRTETTSGALRSIVLDLLRRQGISTPSEMVAAAKLAGVSAGRDQVSKALADLLRDGNVAQAAAPHDSDRRNRYFTLADAEAAEAKEGTAQSARPTQAATRRKRKTHAELASESAYR